MAAVVEMKTPLVDARTQLSRAVEVLGYSQGLFDMLATPRREWTVSVPLRRDDGFVELLVGHRVQHNLSRVILDLPSLDVTERDELDPAWHRWTHRAQKNFEHKQAN